MIHQFKNYVLRQDTPRIKKVHKAMGKVLAAIEKYRLKTGQVICAVLPAQRQNPSRTMDAINEPGPWHEMAWRQRCV